MKKILLIAIVIAITSCSSKYIKFSPTKNEIYTTERLSQFLKENKNPKVVLRTPVTSIKATEEEDVSFLYGAIEKEFLSQGFIVRDRSLFNQVVANNQNSVNYSKLKDKTDTDLIIELIKIDGEILYETNKYTTEKGKTGLLVTPYKRYGAAVEFKVVLIDNNEFAGTFKFNYAPCSKNNKCVINESWKKRVKRINKGKESYEKVKNNDLEDFIRGATRELVNDMRN